jgi:hypothetical protein
MELNTNHRQSLLSELEKAQQDAELQQSLLNKKEHKDFKGLIEWFEISHFLATKRIELIKKAIIESDIDY